MFREAIGSVGASGLPDLEGVISNEYGFGKITRITASSPASNSGHFLLDTAKGKYLLRFDDARNESELKREIDLLCFLNKHSFPCPHPVPDREHRLYQLIGNRCLSVYRYHPGRTVKLENLTLAHLESVGSAIGQLHMLGRSYKKAAENRNSFERVGELYLKLRHRLPAYFSRTSRVLEEEFDYLHHYLESKLPKGVIHGSLSADRLIFRGDRLAAVLGFGGACRGKFIFDLATAVNGLCFVNQTYVLERFQALISGYESVRTLSLAEWDAFPNELRCSALRFAVAGLSEWLDNNLTDGAGTPGERDFHEFFDRLLVLRREKEGGIEDLLMAMATGYDYRRYQKVKANERSR